LALNQRQKDVAKKPKIETEKQTDGKGSEPTPRGTDGNAGAATKPKAKKTATPKRKTVRTVKPTAPKKASPSASIYEPSDEEIRIRAYFIAERRIELSLQGDSAHDWIEARRQLVEEANRAAS
jgi:hypothetical protein